MLRRLACLLLATTLLGDPATRLPAGEDSGVKVGDKAPVFSWTDPKGKTISLESLKGKIVIVDCFTSFLGPQVAGMPWKSMNEKDLMILAVGNEDEEEAKSRKQNGKTFTVVPDIAHKISNQYAPQETPSCYVIGRDGMIKFAAAGYGDEAFDAVHSAVMAELVKK